MENKAHYHYHEHEGVGGISAKVIAYSRHPTTKKKIITWQLRYPRFIHGELMTHRLFSRNAASSRAIPVSKLLSQVFNDPAMPIHWGRNQPGMQANSELLGFSRTATRLLWKAASVAAGTIAWSMSKYGAHKQIANRILEPFQFMETVVTATELSNFFNLRVHKDAQPEIYELALSMKLAMLNSIPKVLKPGEWHLPYVCDGELAEIGLVDALKCSAARCARVSYLNHDQSTPSVAKDLALYNMLAVRPFDDGKGHVLGDNDPVHLSPLEHQAKPMATTNSGEGMAPDVGITALDKLGNYWSGNFKGWVQYRQHEFSN